MRCLLAKEQFTRSLASLENIILDVGIELVWAFGKVFDIAWWIPKLDAEGKSDEEEERHNGGHLR